MWKVTALNADGSRFEVDIQEMHGDGPNAPTAMQLAADLRSGRGHAYELLAREMSSDDELRFTAIETWSKQAAEMAADLDWAGAPKLQAVDRGIARYADRPDGHPACVAWHDEVGVLIALSGDKLELSIEYQPERVDEQQVQRMRHRHAGPDHAFETILDWRAYVGHETGIIDGWTLMRQSGRGYVASLVGATGFVVAKALRRITVPEMTLLADPRMSSRLAEMEAKYPDIADECPRLDEVEPVDDDIAMVFVHGTASCGVAGLKDLFSLVNEGFSAPGRVLRFEHDTFLPITDNSNALARLIIHRLRVRKLLLVAHSRGGLVAADAAKLLKDGGYSGDVTLYSFGTPYQGTPLVALGKKALSLLMKLGEEIATSVPVPVLSPLAKAMFYVMEAPTLPPGIMAMQEGAEGLAYLQRNAAALRLLCWGSNYDVLRGTPGYGVGVEGFLLGALEGRPHDLVVPTPSAVACGMTQPTLDCSHSHYFRHHQVRDAIESFLRPPAAVQKPLRAPAPPPPPLDEAPVAPYVLKPSRRLVLRSDKGADGQQGHDERP